MVAIQMSQGRPENHKPTADNINQVLVVLAQFSLRAHSNSSLHLQTQHFLEARYGEVSGFYPTLHAHR